MRRVFMLGSMFFLLMGVAGCGGNPRDEEISKALSYYDAVAGDLVALKTTLKKTIEKVDADLAAKTRTEEKLTTKDLQPAKIEADKLRDVGKKLVEVKAQIDRIQDSTDKGEREELAKQYGNRLADIVTRLNKAQAELDVTLAMVQQRADSSAWDMLQKALKDSREEFEGLTKQR